MISSSAPAGTGAGTSTSGAAQTPSTTSLKEVSAPVAAAPLVAALPTTLSVAAAGGSSSPTDCFTSLFPSYSHNMFSNLLDGDLLDEELNSLLNFSSDPPPPAVATEADSSAGSPPADPVVDPATAPATNSSSTGENDEDEHPGLLVARTAAALDANPVVGEPFFFCTNSETATATQPQAQPSPPQVQATTGRIISTADPLQKIYPKKPPGTAAGQKRAAADLPVPDTLASMTKTMLKKARKITFQSSCGPANTSTTTVAEAAKPTVAAQPAASAAPQNDAPSTGTTTTTCSSERISNKSVSIVDALIHTLQSSSSSSANGPSSGVQDGESQYAPQEHAGSSATSGASSPPEPAQETQAAVLSPPSQTATKREPVPIQPAPPTVVVQPLPPQSSTTATEAIPIQPSPTQAAPPTAQVMIAPAPDAIMSSTPSDSSVASTTAVAVPATSTSDATVVSAEQPPKKKTGGRRPISCELQEVPPEYRKRTRHLSAEEKSEISRNRNRIHARNTRLRKKAYIDDLKKTVNDLVDERDAQRAWQERQAKIVKQNRSVRLMVMEHFLKLHATTTTTADGGSDDAAMKKRWETLLKEDVMICFPSYRQQPEQLQQQPATATGIVNVMTAAKSFVSTLRDTCGDPNLGLSFECDRKSFLMDGATAAVEVTLKVTPSNSDKPGLSLIGSLRTSFCVQTNKIQSSRLLIDFGSRLERMSTTS